jgi:acetyl-CoA synthetase
VTRPPPPGREVEALAAVRRGSGDGVVWQPDEQTVERARLTTFLRASGCDSFAALHARSTEDVEWFTAQLLDFLGIRFDPPYSCVLDTSGGVPWSRWCVDGGLNISEACLDRHLAGGLGEHPAVVWEGEEGSRREMTYAELAAEVERCAAGLRSLGVGRGDAIGIHLPMVPEAVVSLLAAARIGAIAVPLFSGFGPAAIRARLEDVEARVLITCDAFPRRGRPVMAKTAADGAVSGCPTVRHVVVVRRMGHGVTMLRGRDLDWQALLERGTGAGRGAGGPEPTGAEDPLLVLYSSGTTGAPKGIVHSHCGFPIKAAQDMAFGTDVGTGSRICWVTDLGWMMGPWLIYGATLLGATMVLLDAAPDHPAPDRLWAFCAANGVEILGISPSLVRALMVHGDDLPRRHHLHRLRILASTGEPWNPAPWWWLFRGVGGERLPIINYSGGTEISGGILMGNPLLPLKPCSFPAPCPGIAADVVDDAARPLQGEVGELVIRQPWIGMARGFWRQPERYLESYWNRWPDLWVHGDWARVDADGHWYVLGRSDDTLKVAGKRVGPAEVESALVGHPSVREAAVVGVPHELKGMEMVAFCVPASTGDVPPGLAAELLGWVGGELGRALAPQRLFFVDDLPRTRNAKLMRRVIRAAFLQQDSGDVTSLENPGAVELIRGLSAAHPDPTA